MSEKKPLSYLSRGTYGICLLELDEEGQQEISFEK